MLMRNAAAAQWVANSGTAEASALDVDAPALDAEEAVPANPAYAPEAGVTEYVEVYTQEDAAVLPDTGTADADNA